MNEQPLLFLDVDGVVNAFGNEDHPRHETEGGPCFVPDGMGARVRRLVEVYEPVWATAWLGGAHRVWSKLLDLEPLAWQYVVYDQWKLIEIIRMAGTRRWAWVDDDAPWELDGLGWTSDHAEGLIIAPDPTEGLTDQHVEQLITWALQP